MVLVLAILAILVLYLVTAKPVKRSEVSYDFFLAQIKDGNIRSVQLHEKIVLGVFKHPPEKPVTYDEQGEKVSNEDEDGEVAKYLKHFRSVLPQDPISRGQLTELLSSHPEIQWKNVPPDSGMLLMVLMWMLPIGVILFIIIQYRRQRDQVMGGGFLSGFSKSPAKRYEGARQGVTFDDVAGLEGVKADLMEIVDFLKTPDKFRKLGGRVPKGVLLNGPPGTGKTLLARAVAGEAGVPFYSVNGSEFIQMFVGVGASRVRDLFRGAKENAPAIIFVDEIDAVGRQRGAGLGGGHDEREQTLNQILSEMDGFSPNDSVIVVAATNRPDVLDPALLRPGRFDRHITVGRPTHKGRVEIFKVHVRDVPLADDVDLEVLASGAMGLTGADIRNLVNEAALWAARNNKTKVEMSDFDYARDKVLLGAKREEAMKERERAMTAFHEAGHTLTSWRLEGGDRVRKVTIIPRGRALGVTQIMPDEDRLSMSETELRDQLVFLLGGRAAEKIVYKETTVGAENDLERATGLARRMVTHWGMSQRLGPVSYKLADEDPFLGRELHQQRQFSEHTMEMIDEEVAHFLRHAEKRAEELLAANQDALQKIADALLEREELDEEDLIRLIGPPSHQPPSAPAPLQQASKGDANPSTPASD